MRSKGGYVMLEIKEGFEMFYIGSKDSPIAEISFGSSDKHKIYIHHTAVNPELKGQGVGKELVNKVVELARKQHKKVVPICSFAVREFEKHPEYSDVWFK